MQMPNAAVPNAPQKTKSWIIPSILFVAFVALAAWYIMDFNKMKQTKDIINGHKYALLIVGVDELKNLYKTSHKFEYVYMPQFSAKSGKLDSELPLRAYSINGSPKYKVIKHSDSLDEFEVTFDSVDHYAFKIMDSGEKGVEVRFKKIEGNKNIKQKKLDTLVVNDKKQILGVVYAGRWHKFEVVSWK